MAESQESEIVPDPDAELRLAQPLAASRPLGDALVGEHVVLPVLVEERPPGPVEVDRESEREGFEAKAIRRAAVHEPEPVDSPRLSENGSRQAWRRWIERVSEQRADRGGLG